MKLRYIFVLIVLCMAERSSAQQQIPNASFEEWTVEGEPIGWFTNNVPGFLAPITRSDVAAQGQFSLQGEVLDFGGTTVAPLAATSGDSPTGLGFPYTDRPGALNGFYTAALAEGDRMEIYIAFTRQQSPVGFGNIALTSASAQTGFSIPITFLDGLPPDTAFISVTITNSASSGSSPAVGSKFTIDALSFGSSSGVGRKSSEIGLTVIDHAYSKEISFAAAVAAETRIDILDIHGRTWETIYSGFSDRANVRWDGRGLPTGLYLCRVTRPDGVQTKKLMLTH